MKKLIALLMVCTTITCVFASCGDEEKESSVSKETSVSDESSETETTAEPETEEETEEESTEPETEEETEEETESEEETEKTTHEYIEADPTAFLGKWECEKMVINGEEMTELMGIPVYALYPYDIKEDGTVGFSDSLMEIANEEDNFDYTWGMISETEIEIVNGDGIGTQFTLDGDYLVNIDDESGTEVYLIKVDEFTPFDFQSFIDNYQPQENEVVLTPVETDADGNIIESSETVTAE